MIKFNKETISDWMVLYHEKDDYTNYFIKPLGNDKPDDHNYATYGDCYFKYILGTDPKEVCNRVAFIEKSPRIRVLPFSSHDTFSQSRVLEPNENWIYGGKGGPIKERMRWCDLMLDRNIPLLIESYKNLDDKISELTVHWYEQKCVFTDEIQMKFNDINKKLYIISDVIEKLGNTIEYKNQLKDIIKDIKLSQNPYPYELINR